MQEVKMTDQVARHKIAGHEIVTYFSSIVITALYAMQTLSSDENSVCLSIRPSIRPSVRLSNT